MANVIPSPSPSPFAFVFGQAADQTASTPVDWTAMIQQIISAISGTTSHPILAMVGVGTITALGSILYFIFKGQITAWLQSLAQKGTDQGKTDFVNTNTPTNEVNTNTDNTNRGKLDGSN